MFKIKGKNKGFTLIELIVVIAVLAILVTMGVPRYLGHTKDANVATMQADTKIIEQAAYQYALNNDDAWPYLGGEEGEVTPNWTKAGKELKDVAGDEAKAYKINFDAIDSNIRSLSTDDYEDQFFMIIGGDKDMDGYVMTVNTFKDSNGDFHSGLENLTELEEKLTEIED